MESITLNRKEAREYRLGAALLAIADKRERAGLAFDIHDDLATRLPAGHQLNENGLLVPENLRAGLDTATATKGAELKFSQPGGFIDLLRQKSTVMRLGATMLPGLIGDVLLVRQTGAVTASWVTQNPGSDTADSNLTLDTVPLVPKGLQGTTSFSRQLLAQSASSGIAVDNLVMSDIAKTHAVAIDAAAINGSGTSGQPTGILNTSGIGSVVGGTNGLAIAYSHFVDLEFAVANANADDDPTWDPADGPMAFLTTPVIRQSARKRDRAGAATGWMILPDDKLFGYQFAASKQVPSTLTKGTAVGTCHAVIFGAWQELVVGTWGVLEMVPDQFRLKKQGMIEVTCLQFASIALRHAASFAAMVDALP